MLQVEKDVNDNIESVWKAWTHEDEIVHWYFASRDWKCSAAKNNPQVGGEFSYRMEARDGSMGFDFEGVYTDVIPQKMLKFDLSDGRKVEVTFEPAEDRVRIIERFDPDEETDAEMQLGGWQAILNNFAKYVESKK